jgi:hypothetical protein
LYTGTIGETYGVFEAISLAKKLHRIDDRYILTIIGYAAQTTIRDRVLKETNGADYIHVIGLDHPVPHVEIIRWINLSDIALTPYLSNRSTRDKIPTKFYEYIFHRIPFIMPHNPLWHNFALPYQAAVTFDFLKGDIVNLLPHLHQHNFFRSSIGYRNLIFNLASQDTIFSKKICYLE